MLIIVFEGMKIRENYEAVGWAVGGLIPRRDKDLPHNIYTTSYLMSTGVKRTEREADQLS
jgi:hypothetical protein